MGTPIRNLALVGHAGAGKTTLAEGIAFAAGAGQHWSPLTLFDNTCARPSSIPCLRW